MKFRPISDLHLEFYTGGTVILPKIEDEVKSTLILAGDIGLLHYPDRGDLDAFLKDVCSRYKYVFYIAGNHEYYHGNITEHTIHKLFDRLQLPNLFTNHLFIEDENIVITGDTLWTDFKKEDPLVMEISRINMNDYNLIRIGETYSKLFPSTIYAYHAMQKRELFNSIKEYKDKGCKIVVVTHHHPSYQAMEEEFRGSDLNFAYMSDLDNEVTQLSPDWWICGHQHKSKRYKIGNTEVICNPVGYPGQITGWDKNFTFEL